jgi:hypothetical protein
MNEHEDHFAALRRMAEEQYRSAVAAAKSHRDSRLTEIAALERGLRFPQSAATAAAPPPRNGYSRDYEGPTKTDIVLKALNREYKRVAQIVAETGLTNGEVSGILGQPKTQRLTERDGEPGRFKYRLKKQSSGAKADKPGADQGRETVK